MSFSDYAPWSIYHRDTTILGQLTLLDSSPASSFDEPLTTAEVKEFLGLPERSPADAAEDALIDGMIIAAREAAETEQGRDLVRKQYRLSLEWLPPTMYFAVGLRAPLVSVDLVRYKDSDGTDHDLIENTDYIVDLAKQPGAIMPPFNGTWPAFTPWPASAVTINFTSGYTSDDAFWSDSGARIKIGMKLLISEWFNNRLPVSYDTAAGGGSAIDRIKALLRSGALPRAR